MCAVYYYYLNELPHNFSVLCRPHTNVVDKYFMPPNVKTLKYYAQPIKILTTTDSFLLLCLTIQLYFCQTYFYCNYKPIAYFIPPGIKLRVNRDLHKRIYFIYFASYYIFLFQYFMRSPRHTPTYAKLHPDRNTDLPPQYPLLLYNRICLFTTHAILVLWQIILKYTSFHLFFYQFKKFNWILHTIDPT